MSDLHYELVGPDSGRTALIAHGILGMGRNWRSVARRLADKLPGWRFALVDLRNHGKSQGFAGPHTVASAATDLDGLVDHLGPIEVAVGHSFGGKVVLEWLRSGADLRQTWVLDSPLGIRAVDPSVQDTLGVIAAVRSVPTPAADRNAVRDHLRAQGLSEPLIQWLLTSLQKRQSGWDWVWDLDAVDSMIRDYLGLDWMTPLAHWDGPRIELVRAGRSDRWLPAEIAAIESLPSGGPVDLHELSNAGHWLHVDDPVGLLELLGMSWAR